MYITAVIFSALCLFLMHGGVFAAIAVIAFCIWVIFPIDFSTACIIAIVFSVFLMIFLVFIDPKIQRKQREKAINKAMPNIEIARAKLGLKNVPMYTFYMENKNYNTVLVLYDTDLPIYTRASSNGYMNYFTSKIHCIYNDYGTIQFIENNTNVKPDKECWNIKFEMSEEGDKQRIKAFNLMKRLLGKYNIRFSDYRVSQY